MEQWISLIQGIGIPAALLLILVRGLWLAAGWVARNVVTPIVTRHIKFVDEVSAAVTSMTAAQTSLTERLGRLMDTKCLSPSDTV